jgi:hypothetical protein
MTYFFDAVRGREVWFPEMLGRVPAAHLYLNTCLVRLEEEEDEEDDPYQSLEVLPAVRSGALPFAAKAYESLCCEDCGRVPSMLALASGWGYEMCDYCESKTY